MAAALALMLLALTGLRGELAAAGPVAEASATKRVEINHFAFHPPTLTIARGTTVKFANASQVTHTATAGGVFNSGHIGPGMSISIRFNQVGSFSYHCMIHPLMHGKIIVQ
ncbi:MAG: cupredoxin domain-containing protein [Solirubrobacterales bacterium]|nr:cupredoxin domain-containing protein [Solirubrobacterales bacterium]